MDGIPVATIQCIVYLVQELASGPEVRRRGSTGCTEPGRDVITMLLCGGSTTHETFFRDQPRYPQRIALGSTEGKVNSKQHTHLAQLLLGILTWLAKWDSSRCSCSTIHGDWTVSIHRCRVHGLKYYSRAMIMPLHGV